MSHSCCEWGRMRDEGGKLIIMKIGKEKEGKKVRNKGERCKRNGRGGEKRGIIIHSFIYSCANIYFVPNVWGSGNFKQRIKLVLVFFLWIKLPFHPLNWRKRRWKSWPRMERKDPQWYEQDIQRLGAQGQERWKMNFSSFSWHRTASLSPLSACVLFLFSSCSG